MVGLAALGAVRRLARAALREPAAVAARTRGLPHSRTSGLLLVLSVSVSVQRNLNSVSLFKYFNHMSCQLFSETGLRDDEMDGFFTGPAFLPWFKLL